MRVAFITHWLSRKGGGLSHSVRRLGQTLNNHPDVEIAVSGIEDPFFPEDSAAWAPLAPTGLPALAPGTLGYAPGLRAWMRRVSPEITHCHGLWIYPSLVCLRHLRETRRPHIISPHGMLDAWALGHSAWKKRIVGALFENAHLREADCIHALCQSEAESIRAYGLRNAVCLIPNGIDLPSPADVLPTDAGVLPPNGKVVLYLGRLHSKKGLPDLIRAWPAADPSWHLVIAGWDQGGHEDELKKLAAELHTDRVHFTGPQFDAAKSATYRRADAFILPSRSEGLPMVILEAWAHEKPVLMTNECNLPEGFAAGAAIRIAPDPDSIARGLRELASLPDAEWREMGRRGRRLVEQRFTWAKVANDFRAVYQWILRRGPQPECVTLPDESC